MVDLKSQGIGLSLGHKGIFKRHARDMTPTSKLEDQAISMYKEVKILKIKKMLVGYRVFANTLTSENTLQQ